MASDRSALIGAWLACVAVVGVILVFRVPPMAGFDEPFHWRRVLQLADGQMLARRLGPNDWGGKIDAAALAWEARADQAIAAGQPLQVTAMAAAADPPAPRRARTMSSFPSSAVFSPVAYAPSALGLVAARSLRLSLLAQFRAARLANLAAYLLLVWLTVQWLPVARLAVLALLTNPTALHLASSLSADPLSNAVPALFLGACLRLSASPSSVQDRALPTGWQAGLLGLAWVLGLLKPTGVLLCLLVVLVPERTLRTRRAGWAFRGAAIAGCVLLAIAWTLAFPFVPGRYWHAGADPAAAVPVLLRSPLHTLLMLATNAWNDRWFWWVDGWGRFGGGPGPYHFTVPLILPVLGLAGLAGLVLADRGPSPVRPRAALLLLGVAGGVLALLLLAFRIGYSPPQADFIDGVQGRYLLLPEVLLAVAGGLVLPGRLRAPLLAPGLFGLCVLAELGAWVVALGRYAALWH